MDKIDKGDCVTVYFGGATDDGVGEATIVVNSVGDTLVGRAVESVRRVGRGPRLFVHVGTGEWEIDSSAIHATHWLGNEENCKLIEPE